MRKIFYLVIILGVVFTSCDPMGDVYSELDQLPSAKNGFIGDAIYTLTDEDYTLEKSDGGFLELRFENFNSIEDAKTLIPDFLTGTYPVWGVKYKDEDGSITEASSALITFKWYNKKSTYSENIYELSSDEHNEVTGGTFGNFDRDYHITNFLEAKYPNAEDGDFYSLRYKFYAGSVTTLTDGFYFDNGEWQRVTGFTPAQYNAMGEGFPNFSSHDEAEAKTPIALLDIYKFDPKSAGDIVETMYELYKGGGVTKSYTANYVFDGTSWSKYNNVAVETIQFGHNGTTWLPDNTIKFTVGATEVAFIANALSADYPGPTSNVLQYGSFDRRPGGGNYWDDDLLLKGFNILLDNIDPSAVEEQKYVLTIVTYTGATVNETFSLIKTGGVWIYKV